jgi:hypothetical protein
MMASPAGLEPATCGLGRRRPDCVSDGLRERCADDVLALVPGLVPADGTGSQPEGTDGALDRVVVHDPELCRLVSRWPRLPAAIKRRILAMIDMTL